MSIKKLANGKFCVDVRPAGSEGKRFRRRFDTRGEAVLYERHVLQHYHDKDWVDKPTERRSLRELLDCWWLYHGKIILTVRWGECVFLRSLVILKVLMLHAATNLLVRT